MLSGSYLCYADRNDGNNWRILSYIKEGNGSHL